MAVDRAAIERVIMSYGTLADTSATDQMPALFTEDGEVRAMGRTFAGERLVKFFGAAPKIEPHSTKHVFTNVVIDVADDGVTATSCTYFQVLGTSGLQAWGRYLDTWRAVDGAWKIAVREVAVDGHVS